MTHADIDTTTTRPPRKPIPVKPRWRPAGTRGALRQPPASVQGLETCPVASLAEEAAAVLRLNRALREEAADHDLELFKALEAPDDYVRPSEMKEALFDRLKAISELASHRRSRSLKGALDTASPEFVSDAGPSAARPTSESWVSRQDSNC